MEQAIGVFGEDVLLWAAVLRQSPQRPPAHTVLQHANYLLDELARAREAQALPVQLCEDGMFAIAALIDEMAMGLPDLRATFSAALLQAQRFNTNNAGVEVFHRLARVRQGGPSSVLATYAVVLALGFQGCYGLPGADRYVLAQLRRELAVQLGVDPDRDRLGGVLREIDPQDIAAGGAGEPWFRSLGLGRALAILLFLGAIGALVVVVLT